jgi:hypothetical protein
MKDQGEVIRKIIDTTYDIGYKHGLAAYAHMKDGTTYVGTAGIKLKEAIADAKNTYNYALPSADSTLRALIDKIEL